MVPELVALAEPPPLVETCKNWLIVPELVALALPPALEKLSTDPLTVPELLTVAFWVVVASAKVPLVPELVQVWVLPLVLHANCAQAGDCDHSSDIAPKTASQTTIWDRGRLIGDGTLEISIDEPILSPPARKCKTSARVQKCSIAGRSKAKH